MRAKMPILFTEGINRVSRILILIYNISWKSPRLSNKVHLISKILIVKALISKSRTNRFFMQKIWITLKMIITLTFIAQLPPILLTKKFKNFTIVSRNVINLADKLVNSQSTRKLNKSRGEVPLSASKLPSVTQVRMKTPYR